VGKGVISQQSTVTQKLDSLQLIRAIASVLVVLAHGEFIFYLNLDRDFLFDIFAFGGSGLDFFL
jgi:exopolysaccharide production protein ExoZ